MLGLRHIKDQVSSLKQGLNREVNDLYRNKSSGQGVVLINRPRTRDLTKRADDGMKSDRHNRILSYMETLKHVRENEITE
jgi:hypothetical protein